MKRTFISTLLTLSLGFLILGLSKARAVEEGTATIVAASGSQGIELFDVQDDGTLHSVGELPPNVGLEGIANNKWLIPNISSFMVSPNRDQIAFSAHRASENALFIYSILKRHTQQKAVPYSFTPIWAPDGAALLLSSPPLAYIYEIASNQLTEITHAPNEIGGNFQWLPDAAGIFYVGLNRSLVPPHPEIYFVNRDGSNRRAITHISSDAPADANPSPCNLTWSPANERIYYVVGCLGFKDNPRDYLFSVSLGGENRLELSLPTLFHEDAVITAVRNIDTSPDGIFITYQADLLNGDHHWRVVDLTSAGELQTRFDYRFDAPRELYDAKISPDAERVAFIGLADEATYGSIHFVVGNFDNNRFAADLSGDNSYICNITWDKGDILYETTNIPCFGNPSEPVATWRLNIQTNKTVKLTGSSGGNSWLLPISKVSGQVTSTPTPSSTPSA